MNFLAHASLSGTNELVITGNFIADTVKGNKVKEFPVDMQKGIVLHRFIDRFTDSHETVKLSKQVLRPEFRHYSPVITDVFYDHFLAIHWTRFYPEVPLTDFIRNTYRILEKYLPVMPDRSKEMILILIRQDWLGSYISIEGISEILKRMSRRSSFISNMENAGAELRRNYETYEKHFLDFFPELQLNSKHLLDNLLNHNG